MKKYIINRVKRIFFNSIKIFSGISSKDAKRIVDFIFSPIGLEIIKPLFEGKRK